MAKVTMVDTGRPKGRMPRAHSEVALTVYVAYATVGYEEGHQVGVFSTLREAVAAIIKDDSPHDDRAWGPPSAMLVPYRCIPGQTCSWAGRYHEFHIDAKALRFEAVDALLASAQRITRIGLKVARQHNDLEAAYVLRLEAERAFDDLAKAIAAVKEND